MAYIFLAICITAFSSSCKKEEPIKHEYSFNTGYVSPVTPVTPPVDPPVNPPTPESYWVQTATNPCANSSCNIMDTLYFVCFAGPGYGDMYPVHVNPCTGRPCITDNKYAHGSLNGNQISTQSLGQLMQVLSNSPRGYAVFSVTIPEWNWAEGQQNPDPVLVYRPEF